MLKITPTPENKKNGENELSKSDSPTKRRPWGPKRRAHQAQIARETRPWAASTGPKTPAGKAASARNAIDKTGRVIARRAILDFLRWQAAYLRGVVRGLRGAEKLVNLTP